MSEAPLEPSAGGGEASGAKPPTFEQAIEQLESIIEGIESGEVGLESSLEQYERGMKLIRHCRGVLDRAEQRIETLTVEEGGGLASGGEAAEATEPDDPDDDGAD